jgi:hypothetical protein
VRRLLVAVAHVGADLNVALPTAPDADHKVDGLTHDVATQPADLAVVTMDASTALPRNLHTVSLQILVPSPWMQALLCPVSPKQNE